MGFDDATGGDAEEGFASAKPVPTNLSMVIDLGDVTAARRSGIVKAGVGSGVKNPPGVS